MKTRIFLAAAWTVSVFLAASHAAADCPPACGGQTVTARNFSRQDLTGADFTGATIVGAKFIGTNLKGAKFDNAKFQGIPGFPTSTPDFSFADLSNASFTGAQFLAPTYLTYADVTCADFSNTNINNGNAIFGDEPLNYNAKTATCPAVVGDIPRTKFRNTVMNCEFINDWKAFDLTGADVSACRTQLSLRDFSGALMSGVDLSNTVLDGDLFVQANLSLANLDNASLQCAILPDTTRRCVDMSFASLQGAHFDHANLSGASLFNALLSNNSNNTITQAASFQQAHLKNVNLANAQLSGIYFSSANFYGTLPGSCRTTGGANKSGFTDRCASAYKAQMTGTHFDNAFVYGVDFSESFMYGVDFTQAILAGADFANTTIATNTGDGSVTNFTGAFLGGTNLDAAKISGANLSNAFFDFRSGGNNLYVVLDGKVHNQFACSTPPTCKPPSGTDVCLYLNYPQTTVLATLTTITCPSGSPAGSGGCGAAPASGDSGNCAPIGCAVAPVAGGPPGWKSNLTLDKPTTSGPPPGWYQNDATYTCHAPDCAICNGKGSAAKIQIW